MICLSCGVRLTVHGISAASVRTAAGVVAVAGVLTAAGLAMPLPGAWAAPASVQGPPISKQAAVVLSVPIGAPGQATDFVLIREAGRGSRGQRTFFFIPPVIQSDRVEMAGPAEGPLSVSVELLPVFPEKAREIFTGAFGRAEDADIWPATLEYLRVSVPALAFSRTYRQGRAGLLGLGRPFRFEVEVPATPRERVDNLSRALGARELGVELDFGWGAFVEKRRSVQVTGYDLYTQARPLTVLKSGLRVFDRRGLEAAATTLVKTKLAGFLELEVVDVALVPNWDEVIRQVFAQVSSFELARLGAAPEEFGPKGRFDLYVPAAALRGGSGRGGSGWEASLYRDQRTFALGTMTYRDTEFSVTQRLKVGWTAPGQADLNRWEIRARARRELSLAAPGHCRTAVPLVADVQPGERVRVVVDRIDSAATGGGGDRIPLELTLGSRAWPLGGRESTVIATEKTSAGIRLEAPNCERSGLALDATVTVEVAR